MMPGPGFEPGDTLVGGERSHHCTIPAPSFSPVVSLFYPILVPRAHYPSGLWQGSRALAGPDFLSMRRAFVSYSRPIRFDGKSVIRGLPVLDQARACQSSRSLPQARRIVGSGNENVSRPSHTKDLNPVFVMRSGREHRYTPSNLTPKSYTDYSI